VATGLRPGRDVTQRLRWAGRTWSNWFDLGSATAPRAALAPSVAGIYRLRCAGRPGLIYIGQSGRSLRTRLRQLRDGMAEAAAGRPHSAPHFAAPCVQAHAAKGWAVEVSWIELEEVDRRERFGIEVDLIALYRRTVNQSPTCQFAGVLEPD